MEWVHEGLSMEEKEKGVAYMTRFILQPVWGKGIVFALIDTENPRNWLSVAACFPPDAKASTLDWIRAGWNLGRVPHQTSPGWKEANFRLEAIRVTDECHSKFFASQRHWCLQNLAAGTSGKGHGSMMMLFLKNLVEEQQLPLWLETAPDNLAFYRDKHKLVEHTVLELQGKASRSFPCHCMVYNPQSQSAESQM